MKDQLIEAVTEYKYLGQLISIVDRKNKEINTRIANAWKKFWSLKNILKIRMKISTKIRVFESGVVPVLLYGAQTWSLTKIQTKRINTTHNRMLRSILNIKLKDKVPIEIIKNRTKTNDIRKTICKLKLTYAGHLARKYENWANRLLNWTPGITEEGREGPPDVGVIIFKTTLD